MANTAARLSRKSKIHAIAASPMAAIAIIGIKTNETMNDVSKVYNGYAYKTSRSTKPTK